MQAERAIENTKPRNNDETHVGTKQFIKNNSIQ